jgi:hypothetical protein
VDLNGVALLGEVLAVSGGESLLDQLQHPAASVQGGEEAFLLDDNDNDHDVIYACTSLLTSTVTPILIAVEVKERR